MDREEAIKYLSPIAESAALPRYKEALMLAISALKDQMSLETEKQATGKQASDALTLNELREIAESAGTEHRDTVGERIKNARKRAKLTQSEVAERIGVHGAGISAWERSERKPKIETLRKIATAIGCDLKELLEGEAGDTEKGHLK